jgi:uncharacterized damage-inducible protein DinB
MGLIAIGSSVANATATKSATQVHFETPSFTQLSLEALKEVSDKIVTLGELIPEKHYDWMPVADYATVKGVLRHVSIMNYHYARALGDPTRPKTPKGQRWRDLGATANKDEALSIYKESVERIRSAILATPIRSFTEKVPYYEDGRQEVKGRILFIPAEHANEHMGQLTTYARMHGIKTPW